MVGSHLSSLSELGDGQDPAFIAKLDAPVAVIGHGPAGLRLGPLSRGFVAALGAGDPRPAGGDLSQLLCSEAQALLERATASAFANGLPARFFLPFGEGRKRRRVLVEVRKTGPDAAVLEVVPDERETGKRRRLLLRDLNRVSAGKTYVYDRSPATPLNLSSLLGFGRNCAQTRAQSLRKAVHTEDLGRLTAHRRALASAQDGEIFQVTVRLRHQDGDWRWIQVSEQVLSRKSSGQIREVLGQASDVSERHALADAGARMTAAVANAELGERRRIGRDLHDSIAQHLVVIDLTMSRLEREATVDLPTDGVEEIRTALKAIQTEVRTLSFLLHPPELQRLGLSRAIERLAVGFSHRAGFRVELALDDMHDGGTMTGVTLYRIAQEALMNIHKHARAACVCVGLSQTGDMIELHITDDGVGNAGRELEHWVNEGVGFLGMRARLAELGGRLDIRSLEPGFYLRAICPKAHLQAG